jgi:hypothetical protein
VCKLLPFQKWILLKSWTGGLVYGHVHICSIYLGSSQVVAIALAMRRTRLTSSRLDDDYFFYIGYQIWPLHPEMYTVKSYKMREKNKREKSHGLITTRTKWSSIWLTRERPWLSFHAAAESRMPYCMSSGRLSQGRKLQRRLQGGIWRRIRHRRRPRAAKQGFHP